jgi:hypothetical protein
MNSEEKYIAVYGRDGTHISNIQLSKWDITRKVFDLDVSNFEGSCDEDITSGLIFVMNDKYGNKEYSGFMKSIIQDKKTGHVTFKGEDFRKIWDTEIMLNFTDYYDSRYRLWDILFIVGTTVVNDASSIYTIDFDYGVASGVFANDMIDIAYFDGTYIYVNALKFLKTYIALNNVYLSSNYNSLNGNIEFKFISNQQSRDLRLDDFVFEKATADTKVNHTVARIKFDTNNQGGIVWKNSNQTYYDAQSTENKDEYNGSYGDVPENDYANPSTLPVGFALKFNTYRATSYAPRYMTDYFVVAAADSVWKSTTEDYYNECESTNKQTIVTTDGQSSLFPSIWKPNVSADDFNNGYCIKIDPDSFTFNLYFRVVPNSLALPSKIIEKHYYLGIDNEIHKDTIDLNNQIYPLNTKYYEDDYLSKSQYNAIWELVNSRFNYSVLLDSKFAPTDIKQYQLYDMITVYDKNNNNFTLPISEINYTNTKYIVKLGFKKTYFTDIVKDATGTSLSGIVRPDKKINVIIGKNVVEDFNK